ncbi:MAG: leucine-rich repeat domain-containing protein [Clostridia bacterium]|nr:leucine-rich repeat domain-containing protein [Clostridia bacterium]
MNQKKSGWARSAVCACFMIAMLALFAASAGADEKTDASGQWTYVLEGGGATITGYAVEPEGDLVIPNALDGYAVTGIGLFAFEGCDGLISVTIPDSVVSISEYAFLKCSNLTSVTLPNGVTSIGDCTFYWCSSLISITIPDGVTSIGNGALSFCGSLSSVTIPGTVTSIGEQAFAFCSGLISATVPESVTHIGTYAFRWCSEELTLSVKEGSYAHQFALENDISVTIR